MPVLLSNIHVTPSHIIVIENDSWTKTKTYMIPRHHITQIRVTESGHGCDVVIYSGHAKHYVSFELKDEKDATAVLRKFDMIPSKPTPEPKQTVDLLDLLDT